MKIMRNIIHMNFDETEEVEVTEEVAPEVEVVAEPEA